ncbi:MAG: (d)CMP kinase [Endozoicomonadaceae bacterium]|nr:(d)CMP kinase [Endozoicomonadaceae bacterium]
MRKINDCPVITIDGPVGSGKGSLSYALARQFKWNILDSGSLYRIIAFLAKRQNIHLQDEKALTVLTESLQVSFDVMQHHGCQIFIESECVTEFIREEIIGLHASKIALLPKVRDRLLMYQRNQAKLPGLVADGRDMGTLVFPQAPLKIFLTATVEERARRRYQQLRDKGSDVNIDQVLIDIMDRDKRDMERKYAPLVPDHDAVLLDNTKLSIMEVLKKITEISLKRNII